MQNLHKDDNQLNLVHVIDNCYQFENKGKLDFSYSRSCLYSKQGLTLQTGANSRNSREGCCIMKVYSIKQIKLGGEGAKP